MNNLIGHFINGQIEIDVHAQTHPIVNPSTGQESARLTFADAATLNKTVAIATQAGHAWGQSSHAARQAVVFKFRELLIQHTDALLELIGKEHGKNAPDAKGEIGRAIEGVEFACNAPHVTKGEFATNVGGGIDVYSQRVPIGVVGCITPFNFPVMVPVVMTTMAVAVGNAVILKPSEKVPSAEVMLAQLWKQAGLPDGVFNVLHGDKALVDHMLEHPGIAGINFVGSTAVGEYIYHKGTAHNKRVASFTGGKNHMVVMPDADLEAAATAFVSAGYGSASQRCMAVSLLLPVGQQTAEKLLALIVPKLQSLKVGPYSDAQVDFGPVVSAQSKVAVEQAIARCVDEGGQLVLDGRGLKVAGYENGFYLGPTLFDHVTTNMQLYKEEIFGPVRGIIRTSSLQEAIAITNANDYGNGAVLFTRDGKSAHSFSNQVEAGMIGINVPVPLPVGYFNFGGLRRSKFGDGHMFGPDAARFYTKIKTVSQRWPDADEAAAGLSLAFDSK
ncbi:CoA-acylating methylmalonate-semialdehyde dehydrogenase [Lampropedia puyangensis]|uniref:CoA-acylating methylmalonate-semialdehyde dehydrogenase n=1 Tax=Lampropedia puyangensis TaxID=1330072 RepID=A0A4S8FBS2_9BURK|nr:CoA-acylating methylmalonate-semialdehyde dehydrogenase [Lampropedia puyangensis]THU05030.1 CoA-acylating methylmalonate-semialdehyde dehydrogenase [Lampropedia puyangensis]